VDQLKVCRICYAGEGNSTDGSKDGHAPQVNSDYASSKHDKTKPAAEGDLMILIKKEKLLK